MSAESYNLLSAFDADKHKTTYTNYLEVVIDEKGTVLYAVPSHQEKAIAIACDKLGVTRDELNEMCPPEYYFDFARWLCMVSGVVVDVKEDKFVLETGADQVRIEFAKWAISSNESADAAAKEKAKKEAEAKAKAKAAKKAEKNM